MHCLAASFWIKSQHLFPSRCRSRGCSALPQSRGNLIWTCLERVHVRTEVETPRCPTPGETAVADTEAREAQFATNSVVDDPAQVIESEADWDFSESSSDSALCARPNLDIKLEGAGAEAETAVAVDKKVARASKSCSPLRPPRQKTSSEKKERSPSRHRVKTPDAKEECVNWGPQGMAQSQGHRDSKSSGSRGPLRSRSKSQKKPKNLPKEQQTEEVAQGAAESRKRSRSRGPNKKLDKKKKDKKADRERAHVVAQKKGAVPNARAAVPVSRPAGRAARAHFHPAVAVRAAVLSQMS